MHSRIPSVFVRPLSASLVVLVLFGLAGCRRDSTPNPAAVSADTWAVVDGRPITREEVEKAFRRSQDASRPLSNEETLTLKLSLLNEMTVQSILMARAAALKVELPDSELNDAYDKAKKNMSEDAFQQELKKRNLTPDDMREGLRRELLAQKLIEREVISKVTVTDQDITDFFNANRAQFNIKEDQYRIAQIVVTPQRGQVANRTGDDAATPQTAAAKVGMLMQRLKEGAPFADLAADYSEDPETAPRGGDLGFVPVSALQQAAPELRNAVLKQAPGTVRAVTSGGVHTIVAVIAHEPAGQREVSNPQVRESISTTLKTRREQLLRTAYLTQARAEAKVENYLARRLVETQGKM
jgi:peptidyl-prolyl cis-trans isomerase SurA